MRTLWLTNDLPPRAGGIEQFLGNLLDRLDPDEALVLGPAHADAAVHDAAVAWEVRRAPGSVLPTPAVLRWVREAARTHAPEVVVLGASWPLGELAGALARDPGVPIVALSHGLEAGLAGVGLGVVQGRTTRHLAALTTISAFTRGRLEPHARCAVRHVPPGVDVDRFHPDVDGSAMRAAWGLPAGATVVGCVSRLVPRKGQDALLRVWPRLAAAHPDAWLVLAGTGPLLDRLRGAADGLERVVVTGEVPADDLPSVHAAFDVFAMPCRTRLLGTDVEGLGIVYLEAQASGVPVIAGRSGGAPETIVDGMTGITVDGREDTALHDALARLIADPTRRDAMGRAGRQHVVDRWSWTSIARDFRAVLHEVTGR